MSNQQKPVSPATLAVMLLIVFGIPLLPLLISQQWDWWEAWVYATICILGFAASRLLAARHHPDLLRERARFLQQEDAKSWDKVLSPLVGVGSGLIPLIAGLDALGGRPLAFSPLAEIVALAVILAGYALGSYAWIENRFFSGMVRIQTERGHRVVSSGPYGWVRHPGYMGALLSYLGTPVFLNSWWAFLPTLFIAVVLVVRTSLEDRMLQDELEGYRNYAERVRYRLLPGIW